jgi:hypothetical protein
MVKMRKMTSRWDLLRRIPKISWKKVNSGATFTFQDSWDADDDDEKKDQEKAPVQAPKPKKTLTQKIEEKEVKHRRKFAFSRFNIVINFSDFKEKRRRSVGKKSKKRHWRT